MDIQENPIKTDFERQSFQEFRNWWDGVHDSMKCPTYKAWSIWQQAQKVAVPEGFVLVPREPTDSMIADGNYANMIQDGEYFDSSVIYKAMIEAQEQN